MTKSRWTASAALVALTIGSLAALSGPASAEESAETLAVDFAARTGDFRGGATGTLYGFGDDGAPTQSLINGAHITNSSQKAPYGTQHPSGDAIAVEDGFFNKHGEDMYIYVQDYYPDWPYNGSKRPGDDRTYDLSDGSYTDEPNGVWDYLEVVEFVAEAVATDSARAEDYVFIPFNEPDGGNWYPDWDSQRDEFLDDWQATYDVIQQVWERHDLGHARIGGPGDTRWQPERSGDFLTYAQEHDSLPDIFIWHELGIDNLSTYRSHFAAYRELERSLGIDEIPVNITEYGMLRDMGVPGQLIQWFAMFEDTKVDAQTAYWNYAGNFSDNSARPNGANAGWWMFKWYGDLAGSDTVAVSPPELNAVDTLQGIGAIDDDNRRATVLWGGTDSDVTIDLAGLDPDIFGERVDVEVREAPLTGAEGLAPPPGVAQPSGGAASADGALSLDVETYDRYAGYQLVITPDQDRSVEAAAQAQSWTAAAEAEDLALTDAEIYAQDPQADGGWKFLASGGKDVGAFNRATSRADWTVDVPRSGTYRLQVIGGAPGTPGRHALFVDDEQSAAIQYTADLALNERSRWQYRGSAEVVVDLEAGERTLSIRASEDGATLLPNADITLDKVMLTDVTDGESISYPAATFRLADGAALEWGGESGGGAALADGARADLYATAMETGYQDVVIDWASDGSSSIDVSLNGRHAATVTSDDAGEWSSTARLHLVEGINEIELSSAAGATVSALSTSRTPDSDEERVTVEAEEAELLGGATVETLEDATGTNASGNAFVAAGAEGDGIELARSEGFDQPGAYDVTVHYANAELSGDHDYNPQVVDRRLDAAEGGERVGHGYFRYTYSWDSFWQRTIPVTLSTAEDPVQLIAAKGAAPHIDRVVVSPLALGDAVTTPRTTHAVDVSATTRCVADKVQIVVTASNLSDATLDFTVATEYGEKSRGEVLPGAAASFAFNSRAAETAAGEASVVASGDDAVTAAYEEAVCG